MGYRTVLILNNDQAHEWQKDPNLGEMIAKTANDPVTRGWFRYGTVFEQAHCDDQTLVMLDGLEARRMARRNWTFGVDQDKQAVALLKDAADKLGYRLVKKS